MGNDKEICEKQDIVNGRNTFFYKCWTQSCKTITIPKKDVSMFYYLGRELDKSMFLSPVDDQYIIRTVKMLRSKCQQIVTI